MHKAISVLNNWRWLGLSLLIVGLDQFTKIVADGSLLMYKPVNILPGVNFTLMYNPGAAFSFLSDADGWQRWFFTVIAVVVSIVILFWIHRVPRDDKWQLSALSLLLGGAVGNVIDRIMYGHVIDFFDMYYKGTSCLPGFSSYLGECHWPAFNIADSAIFVSVVILILHSIFGRHEDTKKQNK